MAKNRIVTTKSAPVQNPNTAAPVSPQIGWVGGRTAPDQAFFDGVAADQRKWLPVPPLPPIEGVETEVECGPLVKGV